MNGCVNGLSIPSGETPVGHSPRGALPIRPDWLFILAAHRPIQFLEGNEVVIQGRSPSMRALDGSRLKTPGENYAL
jgi:hypothetical protein